MTEKQQFSKRTLFKFLLPTLGTVGVFASFFDKLPLTWIAIPLPLIVFYLSAAQIRVMNEKVIYRRFFAWKELPFEVIDARWSLFPGMGYIKFGHFLPPWGKLYYIVEEEGRFDLFGRTDLMQTIFSFASEGGVDKSIVHHAGTDSIKTNKHIEMKSILFAMGGLLAGVLISYLSRNSGIPELRGSLSFVSQLLIASNKPQIHVILAAILTWDLVQTRHQNADNVILGFLLGCILTRLIV